MEQSKYEPNDFYNEVIILNKMKNCEEKFRILNKLYTDITPAVSLLYNKYEDPIENHIYFYARTQLVLFINDGWEEGTKFCKEYQLDNINPKLVPWYNPDVYEIKIN